ncbi:MAG: 4'-phosphopantetheinyl transferase, partial [Micromonosporaceae bacterium]|nr:4'-phosphopantetheinyl transferase [Micromonosporaceae bacterium]
MIEAILPPLVASAELFHDPPDARMLPEEAPLVARAVPRRRAEFTTGRHCARLALASLGVEPAAILAGPDRAPRWPAGIVGTITHCDGYRA